jgi:hypothetical protein
MERAQAGSFRQIGICQSREQDMSEVIGLIGGCECRLVHEARLDMCNLRRDRAYDDITSIEHWEMVGPTPL